MNIELHWLKYFYEVAKQGSVTKGAQVLRISQPAVTKMIRQLEQSSKLNLFEKKGRTIALTPEGIHLYTLCQKIFQDLKAIQEIQGTATGQLKDEIHIGASDHLCHHVLPECISRFLKKHPLVKWGFFAGVSSEIKARLISGELDAGICYSKLTMKEQRVLKETKIARIPFSIVVSKRWLQERKKSAHTFTLRDLRDALYIGARSNDYSGVLPEHWIYKNLGLDPEQVLQANSKEMQKHLVLQGLGYAVVPRLMIQEELKTGELVELKTKSNTQVDLLWIEPRSARNRPAIEAFKSMLLKHPFISNLP